MINSIGDLKKLCSANDIILLQEHWLFPFELDYLSNIDNDFCAVGQSAMQLNDNVFRGRPYGGTAIMYRKKFAPFIVDQKSVSNPRVTALILNVNIDNSLIGMYRIHIFTGFRIQDFTGSLIRISEPDSDSGFGFQIWL